MVKIVLDTNVLVSGIFFNGAPNKILARMLAGKFQLCVSAEIMAEYDRILGKMAEAHPGIEYAEILEQIRGAAIVVRDVKLRGQVCSDPDDDKFLACALESKALLVVSGDRALLETNGYMGVHVLKPSPFLALVDEKS